NKAGLDRPISYYETLAPTMWAEVRDGAMKKLQGNMKRRSGTIGIAPQMVGRLKPASAPTAARPPGGPAPPAGAPAPPGPGPRRSQARQTGGGGRQEHVRGEAGAPDGDPCSQRRQGRRR